VTGFPRRRRIDALDLPQEAFEENQEITLCALSALLDGMVMHYFKTGTLLLTKENRTVTFTFV